jgi:hypothetical protein
LIFWATAARKNRSRTNFNLRRGTTPPPSAACAAPLHRGEFSRENLAFDLRANEKKKEDAPQPIIDEVVQVAATTWPRINCTLRWATASTWVDNLAFFANYLLEMRWEEKRGK